MAVRRTPLVELGWRIHRTLYRVSGGRIGARIGPLPVLLLTVRGRRTGEPRTVTLNYLEDGQRLVVFASHAREPRDPPWWLNLRSAGGGDAQVGGRVVHVRAREAEGEEREQLWREAKARDPAYAIYESRTHRRIPVILLEASAEAQLASR